MVRFSSYLIIRRFSISGPRAMACASLATRWGQFGSRNLMAKPIARSPLLRSLLVDGRMSKPSEVIILAEDQTQQRLAYWYLRRLGLNRHVIRSGPLPGGKGSGEQRVRQNYTNSVHAYRTKSMNADTALIVMIDADTNTVKERLGQLSTTLKDAGLQPISKGEKIAHLIPKRNVETWILCLNNQ